MELDPRLLRDSFQLVIEQAPDLTARFYETLFRRKPELEALFHSRPRAAQERMLGEALGAVLDHLEDAPWLQAQLGALGAAHVDYGVTREMYDDVGAALLETLGDAGGTAWTAELETQWTLAYGAIRDLMLAGVRQ
jgi:hemoglobin-like flavoprotein